MRLILMCAFLFSCMTYRDHVMQWNQKDKSQLLVDWGMPTRSMNLQDGREIYEYVKGRCETSFYINGGKVVYIKWKGC
jgi:hypothetical protein